MNRRNFIKSIAIAGAGLSVPLMGKSSIKDQPGLTVIPSGRSVRITGIVSSGNRLVSPDAAFQAMIDDFQRFASNCME